MGEDKCSSSSSRSSSPVCHAEVVGVVVAVVVVVRHGIHTFHTTVSQALSRKGLRKLPCIGLGWVGLGYKVSNRENERRTRHTTTTTTTTAWHTGLLLPLLHLSLLMLCYAAVIVVVIVVVVVVVLQLSLPSVGGRGFCVCCWFPFWCCVVLCCVVLT